MPETTPQSESPYEQLRMLQNMVRLGTVAQVRLAAPARCRVQTGDNTTDWLPWTTGRAGGQQGSEWWPPVVGEQCIVFSPGGDMAQAFVVLGVYSDHQAQPSNKAATRHVQYTPQDFEETSKGQHLHHMENRVCFEVGDGCSITMGKDNITLQAGAARLSIGPEKITANVDVVGDADVIASSISLVGHKHKGVTPGMALTQEPV